MAMYWGLDLGGYYAMTDPVTPYSIAGYTFTQNNFVNIDGVDYQDYVIDLLGLEKSDEYDSRYDVTLAQDYLDKAVEELTAEGVTFPIEFDFYIKSGNQTSLDSATVLKAAYDAFFGEYIDFEIKTYISSFTKEVISYGYMSCVVSSWTADYDDPSNTIEQCSLTSESNAYLDYSYAQLLTSGEVYDEFQEFTRLCNVANAISNDLTARYKAYAEAEAYMIEHNLAMPMYMNVRWQLTRVNDYSKSLRGQTYQNWETNSEVYSTADYNTFAAEREEAIG
jgi:oligopeptide transport system substrate-binding protein